MSKKLKTLNEIITQMGRLQALQLVEKEKNLSSYPSPDYGKVLANLSTALQTMTTKKEVEEGGSDDIPF